MPRTSCLRKPSLFAATVMTLVATLSSPASADFGLSTEVLIGDQTANMIFLLGLNGRDQNAVLRLSTSNNLNTNNFSIMPKGSQTYLSENFSLISGGIYHPASGNVAEGYDFTSKITVGGSVWTTSGEAKITQDASGKIKIGYHYSVLTGGAGTIDFTTTLSTGGLVYYPSDSITDGDYISASGIKTHFTATDGLKETGKYSTAITPEIFDPYIDGQVDPLTGDGDSTITFQPVPEPSSVILLAMGSLVGFLIVRRGRSMVPLTTS